MYLFKLVFVLSRYIPSNRIARSYDNSIFSFLRNLHTVLHQRRWWHPTPVLLPGKSHGQRSPVGCSPWGRSESNRTERLHFHFSPSYIGEENGNPLQYSCLENPRDRGAWWAAIYGVAQSRTRLKRLSILFSIVAARFTFPPTLKEAFLFSIFSSTFITCSLFDGGHLDWYEVIDMGLVLPAAAPGLGHGVAPPGHRPWPWMRGSSSWPPPLTSDLGTPCLRSSGCASAGGPRGAIPHWRSGRVAVRRYPSSKVRSSGYALLEQLWRDIPRPR